MTGAMLNTTIPTIVSMGVVSETVKRTLPVDKKSKKRAKKLRSRRIKSKVTKSRKPSSAKRTRSKDSIAEWIGG